LFVTEKKYNLFKSTGYNFDVTDKNIFKFGDRNRYLCKLNPNLGL